MNKVRVLVTTCIFMGLVLIGACQANSVPTLPSSNNSTEETELTVVAVESFLTDIAQHVAGDQFVVETLIPPGTDPHTFQPTPLDVAKIANSQVLIANGAGLEEWLQEILDNAGGERLVIEASQGLTGNSTRPGDPHFWLDPNYVIHYAEEIRDGYIQIDPQGTAIYTQNTAEYIAELKALDAWIAVQVDRIPPQRRILVTNHESFGYFADRYGFKIIGTIIPSVSTVSSPSVQQIVQLIEAIKETRAPAIFLETGTNPQLAEQVAREAGVEVIKDLYTHSPIMVGGYIAMMRYNTQTIVDALK
jgi:ABC-type Zn uptake system ZnuABC Zn-binding protein ZnuA